MLSGFRRFLCAASLVLCLGFVQPASAASILVFHEDPIFDPFGGQIATALTSLGHSVTTVSNRQLTDADFIGIDTAWHAGSSAAYITGGTTTPALQNFLIAGGGLHLTGENDGASAFLGGLNQALLDNLVNPFITDPNLIAGGGGVAGPFSIATGLAPTIADVLTAPNNIMGSSLAAQVPGELLNVESGNAFAVGLGSVIGAVYGPGEVTVPGARLSIMLDVNWFSSGGSLEAIENLQAFIEGEPTVVAMPEPGTAMLLASAGFLVLAYRRRKSA